MSNTCNSLLVYMIVAQVCHAVSDEKVALSLASLGYPMVDIATKLQSDLCINLKANDSRIISVWFI